MIIGHISDPHLTEAKGDTGEGLDEQVERLLWIEKDAHMAGAELMLVAGDVFHHQKSSAAERNAAVTIFTTLAKRFPVVVVRGNHDGLGEITFLSALRTNYEVHVFERPGEYITAAGDVVACLPFPEKCFLAAKVGPDQDVGEMAAQALRTLLLGWGVKFNKYPGARILLGHVELGTAISDSGQPMTGKCFVEMSERDLLDSGADFFALGHIHKYQEMGDGYICYAGAVRQTTFGEDSTKGYCLVDVERGRLPVIEHRQAPGRQLITEEATWDSELNELVTAGGRLALHDGFEPYGPIIRLKYEVAEEHRQQAAEQAERAKTAWLESGVHSVKIDARIMTTTRVRSEAIREARTNEERLRAYWEARGETPDRAEPILAKLSTIEGEVAS